MPRSPFVRRAIAAAVLVLTGYVVGAGTFHVHAHGGGPVSTGPVWSAHESETGQGPSSCPLCRFAQQPIAADAVTQSSGRPMAIPVLLEGGVVERPSQSACTAARPRAPPAPSPNA